MDKIQSTLLVEESRGYYILSSDYDDIFCDNEPLIKDGTIASIDQYNTERLQYGNVNVVKIYIETTNVYPDSSLIRLEIYEEDGRVRSVSMK